MTEVRSIGILGGGQLGRMLSVAASRLGLRCHIYEPGAAPAGDVAWRLTTAPYENEAALRDFAASVDVITYEFENVPTSALDLLEALRPIRPNRRALAISQDRLDEKTFLNGIGLATAPFADVPRHEDLPAAIDRLGRPAILKTRRMGYDGKGQIRIDDGPGGWTGAPSILEGLVDFTAEISVIVARGADGQVAAFDPGLNLHQGGILRTTTIPCGLPARVTTDAVLIAAQIANALDYVGVMGVELFVTPQGLIVNEIAPRVHNSGHWTQAGCAVDQFEQHVRAVAGLPLGDGRRHADVVMQNLIGDDIDQLPALLASPRTQVHLYGKGEARPGRKMGHVNRIAG
ncbi:5-(carboxyamino)imidazole ribonucleotide synthase [Paracoccus spongiarum]|uniref:N5-carboxyaminoimidazole ribonucleotide synthase n=1 Tax=Paracoccus spongiarum TaxID=3064387 RepID=A0ABT9J8F7_9RHOB|nr:5-(carboxyamino)imidazole ribonucleotide synthase [Paracoccus sp. 2205BS29-5]MDP5306097.1 5-(carboxyamino)imidazole ribonucleotide synthase [Paracoccus sp. 2205BS29-5]